MNKSSSDIPASERALRWIGDLDHEFYNDERNRFVWYEASAIAFQMFVLANMALVGAMLLIGGSNSLPYGVAIMAVNGVVTVTVLFYAKGRYADYEPQVSDLTRSRGLFGMALLVFPSAGFLRAILDAEAPEGSGEGFTGGFFEGFYWGMVALPIAVPVSIVVVVFLKRRFTGVGDEAEDFGDDDF